MHSSAIVSNTALKHFRKILIPVALYANGARSCNENTSADVVAGTVIIFDRECAVTAVASDRTAVGVYV